MATPSERVEAALREMLRHLDHGEQLPTVDTMRADFGVSTSTVVKVLKKLSAAGLVVSKQGWGTFKA